MKLGQKVLIPVKQFPKVSLISLFFIKRGCSVKILIQCFQSVDCIMNSLDSFSSVSDGNSDVIKVSATFHFAYTFTI